MNNIKFTRRNVFAVFLLGLMVAFFLEMVASSVMAQSAPPPLPDASSAAPAIDPGSAAGLAVGVVDSFLNGLAGKYGWITTVVMVIGTLRLLFKPIFSAIENAVANDPAKCAALQKFEAGPIYKAIAFVLDFGASIKLKAATVTVTTPK